MITVSKKKSFKTSIFELPRVKNCKIRLCTGPFTHVSYYWWKESFSVFGTDFDWPSARLETAKNVPSYPSRHILSQHPHSHPSERVPRVTEVAKTANIAKMAENCMNCISAHPTPPHTNPMESGPGNTFSAQNWKKPKDFRPKKGGGSFFDPPPPPAKRQKMGFKWGGGGGLGGSRPKLIGGCFIGQNNDFARGSPNDSTPWGRTRE